MALSRIVNYGSCNGLAIVIKIVNYDRNSVIIQATEVVASNPAPEKEIVLTNNCQVEYYSARGRCRHLQYCFLNVVLVVTHAPV